MSSAMHALTIDGRESVVLRRYVRPELNVEEPDIAHREQRALRFVERVDVPTPRLLACDPTGADAGVPTVVMSRLPGRVDWSPTNVDAWLRDLARVLPPIHDAALARGHGIRPFAPYEPEREDPPPWLPRPKVWERAMAIFRGPALDRQRVFIHRDFHPGNVLWRRGRV